MLGWYSGMCVTVGAHRLWTHKTYKAVLPIRIALMIGYLCAGQVRRALLYNILHQ